VHLVARKKKDFVVETLLNALDVKLQYLRENMVATLLLQSSSCYGGEEVRSKESGAFMSLITYTIMYRPCRVQDPCSDLEEPLFLLESFVRLGKLEVPTKRRSDSMPFQYSTSCFVT
jgi:hypothetical protein